MALRSTDMSEPALQELLFQSNPTLEPIQSWPEAPSMRFLPTKKATRGDDDDAVAWVYKGYIMTALDSRSSRGKPKVDDLRVNAWPEATHDRLDNLHSEWQAK